MKAALVIIGCLLLCGAVTETRETVALRVSPNVSIAPATVRVVVTVEPDDANRELVLEADSGVFFTSSMVQLDGSKAPRLQSFTFKELPAGNYDLQAKVLLKNGDIRKATTGYLVLE